MGQVASECHREGVEWHNVVVRVWPQGPLQNPPRRPCLPLWLLNTRVQEYALHADGDPVAVCGVGWHVWTRDLTRRCRKRVPRKAACNTVNDRHVAVSRMATHRPVVFVSWIHGTESLNMVSIVVARRGGVHGAKGYFSPGPANNTHAQPLPD